MIKKRLKRALGVAIPFAILVISIGYNSYVKMHTFTLSGDEIMKNEQIQPIRGSVKVTGNTDTDVVFTDIESGETYVIANFPCFSYSNQKQEPKRPFFCRGSCNFIIISILKMQ